jgi:arsenate reductase
VSRVLFVCLHNAGRSQMSQALFEMAVDGKHEARSAGTEPAAHVHPVVVTAMREVDVELSDRVPRVLTNELAQWADVVVTMGCGDACPVIPGKRYIDWELQDPRDLSIEEVREIRDDIKQRVRHLVGSRDRKTE